jgi:hypothetical protein
MRLISFLFDKKLHFEETLMNPTEILKFTLINYFKILFLFIASSLIVNYFFKFPPTTKAFYNNLENINFYFKIFSIVLLLPIIEELIFRLPLLVSLKNFRISFLFFLIFIFFISRKYFNIENRYILIVVRLLICFILVVLYVHKEQIIVNYISNNKLLFLHLSTITFWVFHVNNYKFITVNAYLSFFLILILGYYYAFIRLKFGVRFSIFIHVFHNLLLTIPLIIKFIFK